jgi:pimeloyl-ACP methyl ester carboxylesterase
MSHTPPIFIKYGKNSSAFLTLDNPTSLVIFVHGFNGNATGTWDEFPSIIRNNNDFTNSDVIFYGYESLKGQANNNAVKFYNFLKSVTENSPNKLGFKRDNVNEDFAYDKIIIVAHSLGAVIVRRALLNAKTENKSWLNKSKMVLFAPAHRGARVQNIVSESLPVIGKILAGLSKLFIPVLEDLEPNSQTILNLIADSQNYLNQNEGNFTIAHSVVWASNEIVVHNDTFCNDPVASLIDHKSHTSVCKPKESIYLEPYTIVLNAL